MFLPLLLKLLPISFDFGLFGLGSSSVGQGFRSFEAEVEGRQGKERAGIGDVGDGGDFALHFFVDGIVLVLECVHRLLYSNYYLSIHSNAGSTAHSLDNPPHNRLLPFAPLLRLRFHLLPATPTRQSSESDCLHGRDTDRNECIGRAYNHGQLA